MQPTESQKNRQQGRLSEANIPSQDHLQAKPLKTRTDQVVGQSVETDNKENVHQQPTEVTKRDSKREEQERQLTLFGILDPLLCYCKSGT